MKEGEERAAKFTWGENEKPVGYLKGKKIASATLRRRTLRCGELWLRSDIGLYAAAYPKVRNKFFVFVFLRSGVEIYAVAY